MEKVNHTPGEWKVIETFNHFCISDRNDLMSTNNEFGNIATVDRNAINYCGKDEAKANARLIAAAPDLLEALIVAERMIDGEIKKVIKKIIKKATE